MHAFFVNFPVNICRGWQVHGARERAIQATPVFTLDESAPLRYTPGHPWTMLDAGVLVVHRHLLRPT